MLRCFRHKLKGIIPKLVGNPFLKICFPFQSQRHFVLFLPIGPETLAKHCDCAGGCYALNQSTAAKDKQNPEPKEFWVFFFVRYCAEEGNQQPLPS